MRALPALAISLLACTFSWGQENVPPQGAKALKAKATVQAAAADAQATATEVKEATSPSAQAAAKEQVAQEAQKAGDKVVQTVQQQAKPAQAAVPAQPAVPAAKQVAVAEKAPGPSKSSLSVARSAIALSIAENEPENPSETFPPEVRRLYCFTHVKGAQGEAEIQHRWYWNDDLMASIPLSLKSASWRTHSAKTIPAGLTGDWRVAVVDAATDEVIQMLKFKIQ